MRNGARLAAELRRAWNGEPWHGPSVHAVLSRLTAAAAAHRRARGSHPAWDLVRHLTTWVTVPLRRFDDPAYTPSEDEDFPAPASFDDALWKSDIETLGRNIEALAVRVESLADEALERPVGDRGYSYALMINGVVQHLAYHAGQAAVLARVQETAGVIAPPPLIAVTAVLAAELLRRAYALPLPAPRWLGIPLVLIGAGLAWWAHEHFVKARTPAAPWHPSRALVHGGPYRFTRNPMYVGFLLAVGGIGVVRANAWYALLLLPCWALLHWGVVLREERYLRRTFGAPYDALVARTRRWLL